MIRINEENIKDILRHRREKLQDIRQKMLLLHEELEHTDATIRALSAPAVQIKETPVQHGGGHRDVCDVLLDYQRLQYQQDKDIRLIMWSLVEEEESILRVWNCFYALAHPFYSILQALYVEDGVYQSVEDSYGWSHRTFERKRRQAITLLTRYYESDLSTAQLLHQAQLHHKKKSGKKKRASTDTYEQISFKELLKKAGE